MSYQVKLTASAIRDLDRVPARVLPAILEFIYGPLAGNPQKLGKPLRADFEGQWSARRSDYRVLYQIDDDERLVVVTRVAHRGQAYHRQR
ncbi:MAG: type II toxin-antitoxin system RelE/ParE family toxin [Microlunatus sp.]